MMLISGLDNSGSSRIGLEWCRKVLSDDTDIDCSLRKVLFFERLYSEEQEDDDENLGRLCPVFL